MFPAPRPFPQLLISPAQSQDDEESHVGHEDDSATVTEDERANHYNNIDVVGDMTEDSDKHWASYDDLSSRKSSMSSGQTMNFNVNFPGVKTIKVPTFESKMAKLSPIPLAVTPQSYLGSALSVRSSISSRSMVSETSTIFGPEKEQVLSEKMRIIVEGFRARARKVRQRIEQPPTPSGSMMDGDDDYLTMYRPKFVLDDFTDSLYASKSTIALGDTCEENCVNLLRSMDYVDPRGGINIGWLAMMAACFLYNAWVIPFRYIFCEYQTADNYHIWFIVDYLVVDMLYILDMVFFKYRLLYMENGFWVKDKTKLRNHYLKKGSFKWDFFSLLPLDFLYLVYGTEHTIFRLPRLFKFGDFQEFFRRLDTRSSRLQYAARMMKTFIQMLYLIHIIACAYYKISTYEGLKANEFVYDGRGNAYIRCFYFATKTATSIGKNPKPTNNMERCFMTCCWMLGVFFFSILVGNIRDILGTAMTHRNEYRKRLVAISNYMQKFKVPSMVQDRVKLWMHYTWEHQKIFNENEVLSFLPPKMRTDLALKVHYATLSKVKLFQDCDTGLLKELVTKLRPMIFLPGDYICRQDDIGREMYIVQSGYVMVTSPNTSGCVHEKVIMATLGEGSVFGEIALLGIAGMSRRTADVVSKGFSNLFILRKDDLEEALKHFPDATRILNAKARRIMKENNEWKTKDKNEDDSSNDLESKSAQKHPAMLATVMAVQNQKMKERIGSSLCVSRQDPPGSDVSSMTQKYLSSDTESDALNVMRLAPMPLSRRTSLASTSIGYLTDNHDTTDNHSNVITESDERESDIHQIVNYMEVQGKYRKFRNKSQGETNQKIFRRQQKVTSPDKSDKGDK